MFEIKVQTTSHYYRDAITPDEISEYFIKEINVGNEPYIENRRIRDGLLRWRFTLDPEASTSNLEDVIFETQNAEDSFSSYLEDMGEGSAPTEELFRRWIQECFNTFIF